MGRKLLEIGIGVFGGSKGDKPRSYYLSHWPYLDGRVGAAFGGPFLRFQLFDEVLLFAELGIHLQDQIQCHGTSKRSRWHYRLHCFCLVSADW